MIYSHEVKTMCPVAIGANHGPAPIPEEAKWVKAKEVKDISGLTHGIGWCAPQQGACKLTLNVKDGIIQEALVETIGCSGMTHSAAMASEALVGKTLLEGLNTDLVCDAINTAMRELFLQIVYGRSQTAFSEGGLPVGAGLEDLGKGHTSQVGTIYSSSLKGPRYLNLAEGYIVELGLDKDDQIIGYKYVHLGKMMDNIKKGIEPMEAIEKASGKYGRFDEAVKKILELQQKVLDLPEPAELTQEDLDNFNSINKDSVFAQTDDGVDVALSRDGKHFFAIMVENGATVKDDGKVTVDTFSTKWFDPNHVKERLEKLGIKVAFENVEGIEYLEKIIADLGSSPAVGYCWDTGHEMCYNGSMDVTKLFGDKLICTHLNDNLGQTNPNAITWLDDSHLFPFDGIADWQGIADRLKRANYTGELTFELTLASKPGRNTHDIYKDLTPETYYKLVYEKAVQFAQMIG